MSDIDWLDVVLHVLLAMIVYFAFMASPGIGAALFLWIREASQRDKANFFNGMNLFQYSLQKHVEIWPPAVAVELLLRFV